MTNEYDTVLPFAALLSAISILKVRNKDIKNGLLVPKKQARSNIGKIVYVAELAPNYMQTEVRITYSKEEYDRSKIDVLPNPCMLPPRGQVRTYIDDQAERKRCDPSKRPRREYPQHT